MKTLLTPKFLKSIDTYLLLNYRLLWVTKAHYVLYYTLLTVVGSSALVWAYPLAPNSTLPPPELVIFISVLLVLPAAIFWIYKVSQHSIEKNYGQTSLLLEYAKLAIFILTFGGFVSMPLFFNALMQQKIKSLVSAEELIDDTYALNGGNPYFPTHKDNDILWEEDRKSITDLKGGEYQLPMLSDGRDGFNFKPFDLYYNYCCEVDRGETPLTFKNLFLNTDSDEQSLTLIANYISAYNKYSKHDIDLTPKQVLESYKKHIVLSDEIRKGKEEAIHSLYAISKAYKYKIMHNGVLTMLFSIAFVLSTLLLVFQNVKWSDFVLGILSFGLLSLGYGIVLAFSIAIFNIDSPSPIFFCLFAFYGFFFYKSLKINNLNKYSRFHTFSLIFVHIVSPFALFLFITWIDRHTMGEDNEFDFWLITSMLFYAFALLPIYKGLYLKMRALPKG